MSIYHLPLGQYAYSGHVINLPQDIPLFVSSLPSQPSDLDIVIVRKEGCNSHDDFCVRCSKVLTSLQWLIANNIYFKGVTINHENLLALPENDHLTNIPTILVSNSDTCFEQPDPSTTTTSDHRSSQLYRTFIPSVHQTSTEEEHIRQSLQQITTVPWPARREIL